MDNRMAINEARVAVIDMAQKAIDKARMELVLAINEEEAMQAVWEVRQASNHLADLCEALFLTGGGEND